MLDGLDNLLRSTLVNAIPGLADRIGLLAPDEQWRQRVGSGTGVWLAITLIDLRENRTLRDPVGPVLPNPARRAVPPIYLTCHYLISAWNSAKESPTVPATVAEHALLGQVISVLADANPLTPADILTAAELATLPTAWQDAAFDMRLVPPEGFNKLPEYWGTLGRPTAWRPVVWVQLTVPVVREPLALGEPVTTVIAGLGQPTDTETITAVAGLVIDATGPVTTPVVGARVTLSDLSGQIRAHSLSAAGGRFTLLGALPGDYLISVSAGALGTLSGQPVTIPGATGDPIELRFI